MRAYALRRSKNVLRGDELGLFPVRIWAPGTRHHSPRTNVAATKRSIKGTTNACHRKCDFIRSEPACLPTVWLIRMGPAILWTVGVRLPAVGTRGTAVWRGFMVCDICFSHAFDRRPVSPPMAFFPVDRVPKAALSALD